MAGDGRLSPTEGASGIVSTDTLSIRSLAAEEMFAARTKPRLAMIVVSAEAARSADKLDGCERRLMESSWALSDDGTDHLFLQ